MRRAYGRYGPSGGGTYRAGADQADVEASMMTSGLVLVDPIGMPGPMVRSSWVLPG
jgi:hypothetical protein